MDRRPTAQMHFPLFFLLNRRAIGGVAHVDRHADLRIDAESARVGAAQTDLFLNRRNGVQPTGELAALARPAQGLDDDPAAGLVVHRGRNGEVVAHGVEAKLDGHGVADADHLAGLFLVGRADVEPQILDLRHLLSFILRKQVDRLSGDDAEDRPVGGPDGHSLADQHLRIPTADRLHVDEAFVVDVLDDQPDLIAMAGEHDPQRGIGVFHHDDVAVQVGADFVGKILRVIADEPLHVAFIARRAGRFQNRTEKTEGSRVQGGILYVSG